MPVKILGISRNCYRRVDRNSAHQCFFCPRLQWQIVSAFRIYRLTTEIIFSMPSESWSIQLLQPFAAVRSSTTESSSVLYTRALKDCCNVRPSQKVSKNSKGNRAEGREYDSRGYLAVPRSTDRFGGKEERLVVSAAI
jgi:hypothetical protein